MSCWARTEWRAPFASPPVDRSILGGLDEPQIVAHHVDRLVVCAGCSRPGSTRRVCLHVADQHRVHVRPDRARHRAGDRGAVFGGSRHRYRPAPRRRQSDRQAEQSPDQPRRPGTDAPRAGICDVRPAGQRPARQRDAQRADFRSHDRNHGDARPATAGRPTRCPARRA